MVEHSADTDAIDITCFDGKPDDSASEYVHHYHHPITIQQYRFAAEKIDAPQAISGLSDKCEPRRTIIPASRAKMFSQHSPHHIFVDFNAETMGDL